VFLFGSSLIQQMSNPSAACEQLSRWERLGLLALLAATLVVGCLTVKRTAFGTMRRGDFGVYARAAWAVRSGMDLREVTCSRGWHYVYPPTLAVLLAALADPPAQDHSVAAIPFAVSAGIWYVINVLCLAIGVHMLASALEQISSHPSLRGSRPWWQLRVLPIAACLPVVGETLTRGQVNLILLALLSGFVGSLLRGRAYRAGMFLAGAICLKIIPVFLLLIPAWRRDGRCLAGCALGLVVIGLFIPMLGLGLDGTIDDYRELCQMVLAPGLGVGGNHRAANELTSITGAHSQSPMSVIHTWMHPERPKRPEQIPAWTRRVHWMIGGMLVLLTLLAARDLCPWFRWPLNHPGSSSVPGSLRLVLFAGLLILNMLMLSPMCHSHYLCLAIPTFTALIRCDWHTRGDYRLSRGLQGLMCVYLVANTVPMLPGMVLLDDGGMAGMAMLLVWLAGLIMLWQTRPSQCGTSLGDVTIASRSKGPHFARPHASPSTSLRTSSET
jgi:alpha-1,2-mannosyltransferase